HVVVATGHQRVPHLPNWPGRDTFTGELIHSAYYRDPAAYADRDVLIVGAGDSGSGIAVDLARNGAGRVRVAVRTPPNIVPGKSSSGILAFWPLAADRSSMANRHIRVDRGCIS